MVGRFFILELSLSRAFVKFLIGIKINFVAVCCSAVFPRVIKNLINLSSHCIKLVWSILHQSFLLPPVQVLQDEKMELKATLQSQEDFIGSSKLHQEQLQKELARMTETLHTKEFLIR